MPLLVLGNGDFSEGDSDGRSKGGLFSGGPLRQGFLIPGDKPKSVPE